jgi:outer membrane protein assembly factor BamB
MTRQIGLAAICSLLLYVATGLTQQSPTWDPTARPVWRTAQATIGTPAIGGGDVFALTAEHQLLKVSLADGSEQWRVETGEQGVTYGDTLALSSGSVLVGEYDVVAIDRVTGRRRWRFVPREGYAPGPYLGDVYQDVVFAGSASGHLYAIDTRVGRSEWTAIIDHQGDSTVYWPRVEEGLVIAGFTRHAAPSSGGLVGLSVTDGRERWRFDFPRRAVSTHMTGGPVMAGDVVVAASGDGEVWAVDRRSGELRWNASALKGGLDSIVPASDQDYRALAVAGDTIVVGSTTGYVVGYDFAGREVWRFAGGRLGSTSFSMAVGVGVAFIPYVSGFVVALDAATGHLRWRTNDWQQGFIWPPAVAGNFVIASSRQGLWALRTNEEGEQ